LFSFVLFQLRACSVILDALKSYESEDNRTLFDSVNTTFQNGMIVSSEQSSDNPLTEEKSKPSLQQIADRVQSESYQSVDEFYCDIEHVFDKIKEKHSSETQEHKDANELFEFYADVKQDIDLNEDEEDHEEVCEEGDKTVANESGQLDSHELSLEELFSTVMTANDDDERRLCTAFHLLPSKELYPEYYDVISDPIDLKTIGQKIQENEYKSLSELEKDLLLLIKNAKLFNEPGSQIYKDANALRKLIVTKKSEIEQKRFVPVKTSERIKAKRNPNQKWSSIAASFGPNASNSASSSHLQDESNCDDTSEMDQDDIDSIEYQLYSFVRHYKDPQGARLADPFMRMPNRRFYPDYYTEIKKPTSLGKINGKIRLNVYENLPQLIDELNLLFKNAMRYNRSDSKIYKDAFKLQKEMLVKAKELTGYEPPNDVESFTEEEPEDELEEEDENEDEEVFVAQPKKRGRKPNNANVTLTESTKKVRKSLEPETAIKKRLRQLYKTLNDYSDSSGRHLISMFLEKPSKKDYADYYQVISTPIDMKMIDHNIKSDVYPNEEALIKDFKLMFDNCRLYNEDGSQIYMDANKLETVLQEKAKELNLASVFKLKKGKLKTSAEVLQKMKALYDTILNYSDSDKRQLSAVFMKLPSRVDYPEYYDIIKKPIDLDKIGSRLIHGNYETLEELLSDLVLCFVNACKFNEPDSQIYKDALFLQHLTLQTKLELIETSADGIPDVHSLVQDLLVNLFTSVYNQQDDEGRCYIDSLLETIEQNRSKANEETATDKHDERPLSFLQIKINLNKGRYRRLDRFQADVFSIFERVRQISRTDSQAFEDSIEMQQYFIRLRNELCKNGERLISSALQFTEADLDASVENLRKEKLPFEQQESELDASKIEIANGIDLNSPTNELQELSLNDVTYRIGDFVYVDPKEKGLDPHIINIQSITKDAKNELSLFGCWFYRPNETFHLASRKFLQNEVFRSDKTNATPITQVIGKCVVVFVKDYFKFTPIGFEDKDVYVCESRYSTKNKLFKKIRSWNYPLHFTQQPRPEELPMIRVPSVFKVKREKPEDAEQFNEQSESSMMSTTDSTILDVSRADVPCDAPAGLTFDGPVVHLEQVVSGRNSFKLGDFCYITQQNETVIFRIDRIWSENKQPAQFECLRFLRQKDLPDPPINSHPQEVYLGYQIEKHALSSISGRCCVLNYKDFTTRRPTEIGEQFVFLCDNKYNLDSRKLTKLTTALQTSPKNPNLIEDEYYLFRRPISLIKKEPEVEKPTFVASVVKKMPHLNFDMVPSSPMSPCTALPSSETENEESNDVFVNSFVGSEIGTPIVSVNSVIPTPVTTPMSKKYKTQKRMVTGYILFASEVRKSVVQANPASNFGEISRIIGLEWKSLPTDTKAEYERRAQKQNEIAMKEAAKLAEAESMPHSGALHANLLYECNWEMCDYQFEDVHDLSEHLINESSGHVWKSYGPSKDKEGQTMFQCLVKGCPRVKKGGV
jgi:protein polybromo-1